MSSAKSACRKRCLRRLLCGPPGLLAVAMIRMAGGPAAFAQSAPGGVATGRTGSDELATASPSTASASGGPLPAVPTPASAATGAPGPAGAASAAPASPPASGAAASGPTRPPTLPELPTDRGVTGYAPRPPRPSTDPKAAAAPARPNRSKASPRAGTAGSTARGRPIATTPTFEMLPEGASRFCVPLSSTAAVDELKTATHVTYMLKGVQVPKRNDRRPLITTFWNTPVLDARLHNEARGARFVLRLRNDVQPTSKLVPTQDGSFLLQITFPRGDYLPAAAGNRGGPGGAEGAPEPPRPSEPAGGTAPPSP